MPVVINGRGNTPASEPVIPTQYPILTNFPGGDNTQLDGFEFEGMTNDNTDNFKLYVAFDPTGYSQGNMSLFKDQAQTQKVAEALNFNAGDVPGAQIDFIAVGGSGLTGHCHWQKSFSINGNYAWLLVNWGPAVYNVAVAVGPVSPDITGDYVEDGLCEFSNVMSYKKIGADFYLWKNSAGKWLIKADKIQSGPNVWTNESLNITDGPYIPQNEAITGTVSVASI